MYMHVVRYLVPWGHIAGKEWGDPNGKHVLALHGRFNRTCTLLCLYFCACMNVGFYT